MRAAVAIAAVVTVAGIAATAGAYVQNRTSTGAELEWRAACRDLRVAGQPHATIDHAELAAALDRSLEAWRAPTSSCTLLEARRAPGTAGASDVAYDGENVVLWRDAAFCADPANAGRDVCGAPQAAAVTTLFFIDKPGDPRDGEILDIDIAINGIDFTFGDGAGDVDLESVLTHELGHYLGLGHVCHTDRGSDPPPAGDGTTVPFCYPLAELEPALKEATMYNFIEPGETIKRDPQEDEWRGVCSIYSEHPGSCDPDVGPGGCGCTSGSGFGAGAILVLLALSTTLFSRRRP